METPIFINRFQNLNPSWSNFAPCSVELDGLLYPSVEHAFQAAKTPDFKKREEIRKALTPGLAKRLGRKVPLRPDWELVKENVMYSLLRQKFQNSPFKADLLSSKSSPIIENTTPYHDLVWGICYCPSHNGQGNNLLGKLLERLRTELQTQVQTLL